MNVVEGHAHIIHKYFIVYKIIVQMLGIKKKHNFLQECFNRRIIEIILTIVDLES